MRSNDINDFSQDIKKCLVDSFAVQRIAKGDRSTNTFIKIYLTENMKIKFKKPIDTMVLIIPSIEKKLCDSFSIDIIESSILIRFEKQISTSKRLFPISRIAEEIRLFMYIICSQRKKLAFIKIPTRIIFIINLYGFCGRPIE